MTAASFEALSSPCCRLETMAALNFLGCLDMNFGTQLHNVGGTLYMKEYGISALTCLTAVHS